MKENEYKCAMCKGVFNKGWTDEEAKEESKGYFGEWADQDLEVVCDDCFNKIHPTKYPDLAEETKIKSNF